MKNIISSRVFQVTLAFMIVMGLVCAMASPAIAKNNAKPDTAKAIQMRIVKGEIESKDSINKSFVIIDNTDKRTSVTVDDNTKYYIIQAAPFALAIKEKVKDKIQNNLSQRGPGSNNGQVDELDYALENPELEQGLIKNEQSLQGFFNKFRSWFSGWPRFGQKADFDDLEAGDGVMVRLMPDEDLATQVLIIKPSSIKRISGVIEGVDNVSFTVNPEEGDNVTLSFDENTQVALKGAIAIADGQWATVVYKAEENDNLAIKVDVLLQKPAPKFTATINNGK
jgi:hypothetical protein